MRPTDEVSQEIQKKLAIEELKSHDLIKALPGVNEYLQFLSQTCTNVHGIVAEYLSFTPDQKGLESKEFFLRDLHNLGLTLLDVEYKEFQQSQAHPQSFSRSIHNQYLMEKVSVYNRAMTIIRDRDQKGFDFAAKFYIEELRSFAGQYRKALETYYITPENQQWFENFINPQDSKSETSFQPVWSDFLEILHSKLSLNTWMQKYIIDESAYIFAAVPRLSEEIGLFKAMIPFYIRIQPYQAMQLLTQIIESRTRANTWIMCFITAQVYFSETHFNLLLKKLTTDYCSTDILELFNTIATLTAYKGYFKTKQASQFLGEMVKRCSLELVNFLIEMGTELPQNIVDCISFAMLNNPYYKYFFYLGKIFDTKDFQDKLMSDLPRCIILLQQMVQFDGLGQYTVELLFNPQVQSRLKENSAECLSLLRAAFKNPNFFPKIKRILEWIPVEKLKYETAHEHGTETLLNDALGGSDELVISLIDLGIPLPRGPIIRPHCYDERARTSILHYFYYNARGEVFNKIIFSKDFDPKELIRFIQSLDLSQVDTLLFAQSITEYFKTRIAIENNEALIEEWRIKILPLALQGSCMELLMAMIDFDKTLFEKPLEFPAKHSLEAKESEVSTIGSYLIKSHRNNILNLLFHHEIKITVPKPFATPLHYVLHCCAPLQQENQGQYAVTFKSLIFCKQITDWLPLDNPQNFKDLLLTLVHLQNGPFEHFYRVMISMEHGANLIKKHHLLQWAIAENPLIAEAIIQRYPELLVEQEIKNNHLLHATIVSKQSELTEKIVKNHPKSLLEQDKDGFTALQLATLHCTPSQLHYLIDTAKSACTESKRSDSTFDIDHLSSNRKTMFMITVDALKEAKDKTQLMEKVDILLSQNAGYGTLTSDKKPPLQYSNYNILFYLCEQQHYQTLNYILNTSKGRKILETNHYGKQLLSRFTLDTRLLYLLAANGLDPYEEIYARRDLNPSIITFFEEQHKRIATVEKESKKYRQLCLDKDAEIIGLEDVMRLLCPLTNEYYGLDLINDMNTFIDNILSCLNKTEWCLLIANEIQRLLLLDKNLIDKKVKPCYEQYLGRLMYIQQGFFAQYRGFEKTVHYPIKVPEFKMPEHKIPDLRIDLLSSWSLNNDHKNVNGEQEVKQEIKEPEDPDMIKLTLSQGGGFVKIHRDIHKEFQRKINLLNQEACLKSIKKAYTEHALSIFEMITVEYLQLRYPIRVGLLNKYPDHQNVVTLLKQAKEACEKNPHLDTIEKLYDCLMTILKTNLKNENHYVRRKITEQLKCPHSRLNRELQVAPVAAPSS